MNVINSKYYLIISAEVECGIVFFKHIECTQENIKKAKNKNKFIWLYHPKYLSEIKARGLNKKTFFFEDDKTTFTMTLKQYHLISNRIIISFPYILYSKSRYACPFLCDTLSKMVNKYINEHMWVNACTGVINIEIDRIKLHSIDKEVMNMKMSLLPEEVVNEMYNRTSVILEETSFLPFSSVLSMFLSNEYDDIFKIESIDSFYLKSKKNLCDEEIAQFDLKIVAIIFFIDEINKLNLNRNEVTANKLTKNKSRQTIKEIHDLPSTQNNSMISFQKPILKKFNPQQIKINTTCETDYGNKRITKKQIKEREHNVKISISIANRSLEEKFEGGIIKSTFQENTQKVLFDIPHNKEKILSHISNSDNN